MCFKEVDWRIGGFDIMHGVALNMLAVKYLDFVGQGIEADGVWTWDVNWGTAAVRDGGWSDEGIDGIEFQGTE